MARHWLAEATGYVVLTPNDGSPVLRPTVHAAPRPTSDLRVATPTNLGLPATSGSVSPGVTGTGVATGSGFPTDIVSLGKTLELQYVSPQDVTTGIGASSADLRHVGVASDYAAEGNDITKTVVNFGVSTYGDHAAPDAFNTEIDVSVDTALSGDFSTKYSVFNFPVGSNRAYSNVYLPFITNVAAGTTAQGSYYLNGYSAGLHEHLQQRAAAPPATGHAQVANGTVVQNFDTTSLATTFGIGDAGLQLAAGPYAAGSNGSGNVGFLTTFNAGEGGGVSGSDAVNASTLAAALGVSATSLVNGPSAATEDSGLTFGTYLSAGQALAFDYSFFTAEPTGAGGSSGNPDFAFVTLAPGDAAGHITGAATYRFLLDTRSGVFSHVTDPLGPFNSVLSGTTTLLPTVTTAGNYVIGFGVVDANTFDTQSGLAIDNITVVPEPGALSLLAAGLVLGGGAVHRRRRAGGRG